MRWACERVGADLEVRLEKIRWGVRGKWSTWDGQMNNRREKGQTIVRYGERNGFEEAPWRREDIDALRERLVELRGMMEGRVMPFLL